jgi:hypothetical protein
LPEDNCLTHKNKKMIMKKNMMLVGLMMVSTIIFAQRHREDRTEKDPVAVATKRSDKMKYELLLTDAQYTKVKAINEKFATGQKKIKADTAITKGAEQVQMAKLKTDSDTQLKGVLNADQWTKWSTLKTHDKSDRGGRHKGRHGRGRDRK